MTKESFERIFRKGVPPTEHQYPGLGYRITREHGMIIEHDVAVPMRDGVKIYIDVTRPEGKQKVPALIAWSSYGKHRPFQYGYFFKEGGVKREWYSKYTNFEAPDPLYWVPRGYAIINVDPRGAWQSEGDATYWGHEEARDGHDLIEWAGVQEWCNGKVGLSGVSYLAIIQWLIAATQPTHLAAINPWEGLSDMYREFAFHGGMLHSLLCGAPPPQGAPRRRGGGDGGRRRFTEYDHVVQYCRRIEPMSLSTYAFYQGDRNAIGRSRMPMARRRCAKTGPYEVSRSRMRYSGAWSHGKASVIWREIYPAVGFSVTPNDTQIRRPCRMVTRQ
jgi:hypothetical protein